MTDADLLTSYARSRDHAAFAELVRRHADLVYSAALRQLGGDTHRAQEVTQIVFLTLARKSASLARHPILVAWLHQTTRYTASRQRQSEARRLARETTAATDPALVGTAYVEQPAERSRIEPLLDDALACLGERDREAILLRYFANHTYADVGACLGLSENSARMRADRALEKLRQVLAKRGVTSTASALGLALGTHTVTAVPASVVNSILAAVASPASSGAGLLTIFSMQTPKYVASLLLGALGAFFITRELARPSAAGLPTPPVTSAVVPVEADIKAEVTHLRQDHALLQARLDSTLAELKESREKLAQIGGRLAEIRRPLEIDMASSTLSASLAPGEGIVTGGYLLPDGRRLFAFVQPQFGGGRSIEFSNRLFAIPDAVAREHALDTLATDAANTLQHGEVWSADEISGMLRKLAQAASVDLLTSPMVVTTSGHDAVMWLGEEGGKQINLRLTPNIGVDFRSLDLELRLESVLGDKTLPSGEVNSSGFSAR